WRRLAWSGLCGSPAVTTGEHEFLSLARRVHPGEPDLCAELAYQRDREMALFPADFLLGRAQSRFAGGRVGSPSEERNSPVSRSEVRWLGKDGSSAWGGGCQWPRSGSRWRPSAVMQQSQSRRYGGVGRT